MVFLRSNPDVDHDLALVAIGEEAPGPDANSVGLYHFAYELGSLEELRNAYQLVMENSVRIAATATTETQRSLSLDPDGNEVELYALAPSTESMSLETLLKDGIRQPGGVAG